MASVISYHKSCIKIVVKGHDLLSRDNIIFKSMHVLDLVCIKKDRGNTLFNFRFAFHLTPLTSMLYLSHSCRLVWFVRPLSLRRSPFIGGLFMKCL